MGRLIVIFACVTALRSERGEEHTALEVHSHTFKTLHDVSADNFSLSQHKHQSHSQVKEISKIRDSSENEMRPHLNQAELRTQAVSDAVSRPSKRNSSRSMDELEGRNVSRFGQRTLQHVQMHNVTEARPVPRKPTTNAAGGTDLPEACQQDAETFQAAPDGIFAEYQTSKSGKCNLATCELEGQQGACSVAQTAEQAKGIIDSCVAQSLVAVQDKSNKDDANTKEQRINVLKAAQGLLQNGCAEQLCTQICKYPPLGTVKPVSKQGPSGNRAAADHSLTLSVAVAVLFLLGRD